MQKISPLAVDYSTNELLFEPIELGEFGNDILAGGEKNKDEIKKTAEDAQLEDEAVFLVSADLAKPDDPVESGWTFLINKNDPNATQIIDTISPLAKLRQMQTDEPLLYGGEPENMWRKWLDDNYRTLQTNKDGKPPRYILIIGSPVQIPLKFQTLLSAREGAFVGRIDFDSIGQLKTYVQKVKRLEEEKVPSSDDVTFFATNHGVNKQTGCYDGTHYNHFYMEKPLASDAKQAGGIVTELVAKDATKTNLVELLCKSKPSFVYTTSHAMGAPGKDMATQKKVTGGVICDGQRKKETMKDWLMTSFDLPSDKPIVEGGVFFQYSSFSYGSPATSDLAHWLSPQRKVPKMLADVPFIAEMPKKLLFNPKGPIAFVGHLDVVLLNSFTEQDDPIPEDDRNNRLAPFSFAVKNILGCKPVGYSLSDMSGRFSSLSIDISDNYLALKGSNPQNPEQLMHDLYDAFLRRNEAGNYMIFGDPAARLIPTNSQ